MGKKSKETLRFILDLISRFPEGASVEELLLGLSPPPSRRTLQYQLSKMVKEGLIVAIGQARARKYRLSLKQEKLALKDPIPLSQAGISVQFEVTRPIQERKYVTYNRDFLDRYIPNQTFYLPKSDRANLLDLGKTDGNRPAGTYARQIYNRLLIDLSWNSSRLEGNTYSLLETERLIELGISAEGKNHKETQMILNHKAAIEFIIDSAETLKLDRYTLLNLHGLLSDELIPDHACGALRPHAVAIGGSTYIPLAIPQVIDECFQQILEKANAIKDPFERAFFLMAHLPYLQPFEDVNKRVSRLMANFIFIRENLCPLSFVDVPEQTYINSLLGIYELTRVELLRDVFIWAYEKSCSRYLTTKKSLGEPDPFRIQYRNIRKEIIASIVHQRLNKQSASVFIKKSAKDLVPEKDQARFIEVVENEIMALHEGNIARYGLQFAEYTKWRLNWQHTETT